VQFEEVNVESILRIVTIILSGVTAVFEWKARKCEELCWKCKICIESKRQRKEEIKNEYMGKRD
jgi:hypothetical protein